MQQNWTYHKQLFCSKFSAGTARKIATKSGHDNGRTARNSCIGRRLLRIRCQLPGMLVNTGAGINLLKRGMTSEESDVQLK